jgi:transcriptional regulator with XRE-family HTH domain
LNYRVKSAKILTMINFEFETPKDISMKIAENMRTLRKDRKLSMEKLAEVSGVSYGSIRRFESTGEIALTALLKIAAVLDCTDDFTNLFTKRTPQSIQEIINGEI